MYSGEHEPTRDAYAATVRVFAAVCEHHGWTAKSCIGHREWTTRKDDPGHVDMTEFRREVQAALGAGPAVPASDGTPIGEPVGEQRQEGART